jgi:hypothetical protein
MTESDTSASYLDAFIYKIDSNDRLSTTINVKWGDFQVTLMIDFPFHVSEIPLLLTYGVYITHLIRYGGKLYSYDKILKQDQLITE